MLDALSMRHCKIKPAVIRQEIKRRRDKMAISQLVFYDKYNDFLVFEGKTLSLTLSVLFAILDYNRQLNSEDDQQFLCFFEPLLQRAAANTFLQQLRRSVKFHKNLQQLPIELVI